MTSDPTTQYAEDVLAGRIVAGELVKHAAERHIRDLRDGPARGLHWHPKRAQHALNYFPKVLSVTHGECAGQPFNLLPWHTFTVGSLFGWYSANGLRRYRRAWLELGKGSAKSPLLGAIGLYMMGWCKVSRAEVYSLASDRNQAGIVFADAVSMCRAPIPGQGDATLESTGRVVIRGTGGLSWQIEHAASDSKFRALASSDAVSGPKPICVLADEVHEWRTDKPLQLWSAALDKSPRDPLLLLATNTPAVDQPVATAQSEFYQRVVRGEFQDDSAFAYIARVDPGDDPFTDESCWPKALPALGITFPISNVRQRVNTSRGMISEAMATSRLYFGRPVGSANFWIDEGAWNSVQGVVNEDECRGLPCALALDLSRKNDLTALSAAWTRPDGHVLVKSWCWTPREGLEARARADNAPYEQWVAAGLLEAVPGPVIEKTFVAKRVSEICERHDVRLLAFDVWGIDDFERACCDIGFEAWRYRGDDEPEGVGLKLVPHAQGTRVLFEEKQLCMPRSIERLEDAIKTGSITIDDSPVTRMCAGNAIVVADAQNNRAFDKRRSRGRIDILVTICMAIGAAAKRAPEPLGPSVYDILGAQNSQAANGSTTGEIDWTILNTPSHPRFKEMAERFERRQALEPEDDDY